MNQLSKRAEELDDIIASGISDKISLEDAVKIMNIWGRFMEYTGFLIILFGVNIPESILPFRKNVLVGALNKMIKHYNDYGDIKKAKAVEETLVSLVQYTNDEEAMSIAARNYNNPKWREVFISSIKEHQNDMIENGYLVDGKIFKLGKMFISNLVEPIKTTSEKEGFDDLYYDAKNIVIKSGRATAAFLQRELKLNYPQAANIIDKLEKDGIIGPQIGTEPRKILISIKK